MSELRVVVNQYARSFNRYRMNVGPHALNNYTEDSVPQPTTLDSFDVWLMYTDVIQFKQKKEVLEAALQRCINAVEYLVKLVQRNSPSISNEDQFRTLVYPYEYYQNEMRVDFNNLQQPVIAQSFAEELGKQIFDFNGGEYSACYVEYMQQRPNETDRVRFYFIK